MNLFYISIGQAGNQVYEELKQTIRLTDNVDKEKSNNLIQDEKCFHVDSETKVLKKTNKNINVPNIVYNNYGRGSNWALGYSLDYKENNKNNILSICNDKLKSYLEKIDFLDGFAFIHSINGGTGSGISTRLIETIRDDYPKSIIIDSPVFCFNNENTVLNSYNELLSISKTYKKVDLICPIDNERLSLLKKSDEILKDNYSFINKQFCLSFADSFIFNKVNIDVFSDIKYLDLIRTSVNTTNQITFNYNKIRNIIKFYELSLENILDLKILFKYKNMKTPDFNEYTKLFSKFNTNHNTTFDLIRGNCKNNIAEVSCMIKSSYWANKLTLLVNNVNTQLKSR